MKRIRHSIRAAHKSFIAGLVLVSAAALAQTQYPALPLPSTGASAVATFESIGLYWKPGSNPGAAGCQVQYRKSADAAWQNGLAMWYDARNGECRGSLVQLAPGTSYDVQFSLPGQAPSRQLRVSTWSENFPIAQTITLTPGTSNRTLNITQGGSPGGYVLYTTDPTTQSVIDVANAQANDVVISAPYVIVRGLVLKGAQQDAIRLTDTAHDVVIENNDISGWGRASGATSSLGYKIGVDEDSGVRANCSTQNMVRVVVQRNKIHDPRYGANSWSDGHPTGPQGIDFDNCGGNHVIRYNEVYSSTGHYFNDGIGGADNFALTGFPNSDSDIYGNRVENTWDDCIEAEGGGRNVRVWNNYCNNTTTGVASTIVATGPLYIFRNVYNRSRQLERVSPDSDDRNVFAKSGTIASYGVGRRYIFHNTLLQATQSGSSYGLGAASGISGTGSTQLIQNTVSRNNIWHVWKSSYPAIQQAGSGNDFGYDLYSGTVGATMTNGIQGTPIYASGNGWTSESGGMYQLASNSPGYDRGVRIPNFNDNYTGAAPDVGAAEAGTPAMVFGVKGGASTGGGTSGGTTGGGTSGGTGGGTTGGETGGGTTGGGETGGETGGGTTGGTTGGPAGYAGTPFSGTPVTLPGTIEAENFDGGGQDVAYRDTTPGNLGGQYRTGEAVDIISSCDTPSGGYVVNNIATGEWMNYTVNASVNGSYVFALRASNNLASGTPAFHIEVDGVKASGSIPVPKTGAWCTFKAVAAPAISLTAGRHVVRIVADQQFFNLNSIAVTATATTPPPTGGYMSTYKGTPFTGKAIEVPGSFEAENFDLGGQGVAYNDSTSANLGGQYRANEGVDIIASTDAAGGGYVINNFTTGEWLNYTINVATAGSYVAQLRVANNFAGATPAFHVEVDGAKVAGPVTVPRTGSWDTYQWVATPAFNLSTGPHVLRIVADQQYFNLNAVSLAPATAGGGTTGGGTTGGGTTGGGTTGGGTTGGTTSTPGGTAISSSALWSCDFENNYCGFIEQNAVGDKQGGRSSFVTTARNGSYAVRLHTEPGDANVHGSGNWERNDLTFSSSSAYCNQGQEEWWAHSILFPSDYVFPPVGREAGILMDFHHAASNGQSNFELQTIPGVGLRLEGHGGSTISGGRYDFVIPDPYGAPAGSVVKNVWYDFVYHVRWDSSSNGFAEGWVNGKKFMSYRGPTLYTGISCYLKLANYHGPYGVATSVVHDRVVRGSSAAAVSIWTLQ